MREKGGQRLADWWRTEKAGGTKVSCREIRRMVTLGAGARRQIQRGSRRNNICRNIWETNMGLRRIRSRDAVLDDFRRVCGHCFRSPDIASGARYRSIPCCLRLKSKKECQQTEAERKSIAPKRAAGGKTRHYRSLPRGTVPNATRFPQPESLRGDVIESRRRKFQSLFLAATAGCCE